MHYCKYLLLSLFLFGSPLYLEAQILDDSTTLVYGPTTTTYIREGVLYYQNNQVFYPDTVLRNFYRILPVEQSGYRLQNLGNIGTAQTSIFYTLPDEIGVRSGFDVYDYWFNEPYEVRYYNTRSPYTRLYYTQGGNGRSWVDITHARNINPRWSVSADFRRLTSDKQIGPSRRRDDKQTVSTAYNLSTWYRDKQNKYELLANISRLRHSVVEPGGILVNGPLPGDAADIIEYEDSPVRLTDAESEAYKLQMHLFHQYRLVNALQIYHVLDRQSREDGYTHSFENLELDSAAAYYGTALPEDLTGIGESFATKTFQNVVGVKGAYKVGQWNAYAKHRSVNFMPNETTEQRVTELGVGGYLALQPDTLRTLRLEGEFRADGQYYFEALAFNRWLQLRYQRVKYKPAYIYQSRNTLVNNWENNFEDPTVDRLEGTVTLLLGRLSLQPGLQLAVIQKPLFFQSDGLTSRTRPENLRPVQGSSVQTLAPRLRFSMLVGRFFHWDGDVQYTKVAGKTAEALQVPTWLANTSFYYEGPMFGGNLIAQLGVDVHLQDAYFANAYDPALRQFVVQQDFLVPTYPLANLFFGFKINRTRVFARLSHLTQGLAGEGYFITPYYNGIERSFDIGIDWLFFD